MRYDLFETFVDEMNIWDRNAHGRIAGFEAVRILVSGSGLLTP